MSPGQTNQRQNSLATVTVDIVWFFRRRTSYQQGSMVVKVLWFGVALLRHCEFCIVSQSG